MEKRTIVISTISGRNCALVKGLGWTPLNKINPNDQVRSFAPGKVKWINFKTTISKAQERQQKLLAEGYVKDLY